MIGAPLQKYSVEVRTVEVGFERKLAGTETLVAPVTVSVDDPALTALVLAVADRSVSVRVGGGLDGHDYLVAVQAFTTNGDVVEEALLIEVRA